MGTLRIKIPISDSDSPCQTTWEPLFTLSNRHFTGPQSTTDSGADTADVAEFQPVHFFVSTKPICIPKSSARRAAYNGAIVSTVAVIFALVETLQRRLYATECSNPRRSGLHRLLSAQATHQQGAQTLSAHNCSVQCSATSTTVSAPGVVT